MGITAHIDRATDKQVSYINSLAKKAYGQQADSKLMDLVAAESRNRAYTADGLTKRQASSLIEYLKTIEPEDVTEDESLCVENYIKSDLDGGYTDRIAAGHTEYTLPLSEIDVEEIACKLEGNNIDNKVSEEQIEAYVMNKLGL